MKRIVYLTSFLLFCLMACKDEEKVKPENDIDAVRNFIQAALEGNFEKAKTFMLADSINIDRMKMIESANLSPDERRGLATASIIVHEIDHVNDSTTIVIYSNSFKNNWDTLRALRVKDQWFVDFNYLFEHESDSSVNRKDSLK